MSTFEQVKAKLDAGQLIFGTHIFCGTPMLTEAIALIGYDLLWIDMEHTAIGKSQVQENLIAARAGGASSVVRIPWNDPVLAKPILDMGPEGIIFPYIRTEEEARAAISACLYPPDGVRGYGPLRALGYGQYTPADYVHTRFNNMLRILQIEHIDAVRCLETLARVEGVDVFIVGMNDLAASVGHIGDVMHPDMEAIYQRIGKVLRGVKPFGISMDCNPMIIERWLDKGAQMIFCGNDVGYVHAGASNAFEALQKLRKG